MTDADFPPKNRRENSMGAIDILVAGRQAVLRMDPNSLIEAVARRELFASLGEPLPASVSFISGKPGYRYSDSEVEIVLDREELERFVMLSLSPEGYFRLRAQFGMFHMIHDDFYDPKSGGALQPKGRFAGEDAEDDDIGHDVGGI